MAATVRGAARLPNGAAGIGRLWRLPARRAAADASDPPASFRRDEPTEAAAVAALYAMVVSARVPFDGHGL